MENLPKNFKNISQNELKDFASKALLRIKNPEKGIGTSLFDAIIKTVPQVTVDIIVVNDIENPTKVLLTKRNDKYYKGWHFPGGFIRFSESVDKAVQSVILRELGVKVKRFADTGTRYELLDGRGHTIAFIFLVQLNGNPKDGEWFDNIPKDLLYHQKKVLKNVLGWA